MFYYLLPTLMTYDFILVIAAVVPAIFLMIKAYRSDRLEKEPPALLWDLTKAGIFSSLLALIAERLLGTLLNLAVPQGAGGRESLIHTIVRDTKEYYRNGTKPPLYDPHRKH